MWLGTSSVGRSQLLLSLHDNLLVKTLSLPRTTHYVTTVSTTCTAASPPPILWCRRPLAATTTSPPAHCTDMSPGWGPHSMLSGCPLTYEFGSEWRVVQMV